MKFWINTEENGKMDMKTLDAKSIKEAKQIVEEYVAGDGITVRLSKIGVNVSTYILDAGSSVWRTQKPMY